MGFNFPDAPVIGQVFNGWVWDGEKWMTLGSPAAPVMRTDALGWSGMQINGSMEVSQELGVTPITSPGYLCDGWAFYKLGTMVISAGRAASGLTSGFTSQSYLNCTTPQVSLGTGDMAILYQVIEGYRISRLAWGTASAQPITIGFWSQATITGQYSVGIQGGGLYYTTPFTHNVANVAQYNIVTITAPTTGTWAVDNAAGLRLHFTMAAGSSIIAAAANTWSGTISQAAPGQINGVVAANVLRIGGVVVLPGIEAPTAAQSPLIMRPYDQELVTCQRYYRQFGGLYAIETIANGQCFNTTGAQVFLPISPTMRGLPTFTSSGNFGVHSANTSLIAATAVTGANMYPHGIGFNATVASGLVTGDATKLLTNNDINARIKIDARL